MTTAAEFSALVTAYADDLYRYARWLCGDSHRAEDLVQETLLRSWRAFGSLRSATSARAWLLTTLRREYFRRSGENREVSLDDSDAPLTSDELSSDVSPFEDVLDAEQRLNALPRAYAEVLVLQLCFGHSTAEIANLLQITEPAVANRLLRARRAMSHECTNKDSKVIPLRRRSL